MAYRASPYRARQTPFNTPDRNVPQLLRFHYGMCPHPVVLVESIIWHSWGLKKGKVPSVQGSRLGCLPLPSSNVLCCALFCSCGYNEVWHTSAPLQKRGIYSGFPSPMRRTIVVRKSIEKRGPVWLVGHNSITFDNQFFSYHLPLSMANEYVRPVRLVKSVDSKFCFVLTFQVSTTLTLLFTWTTPLGLAWSLSH